jgi:hypothetical protein
VNDGASQGKLSDFECSAAHGSLSVHSSRKAVTPLRCAR